MMIRCFFLLLSCLWLITGCRQGKTTVCDDLNSIKKDFLHSIFSGDVEESPFYFDYNLKTVFFSRDVISLLGHVSVYDHLPHGWWKYEGKTFYRDDGKFKEVKLDALFPTDAKREFLRKHCEDILKNSPNSYFFGNDPLRTRLKWEDILTFVINNRSLIIVFQPYTIGGLEDVPFHIKISLEYIQDVWNIVHPILTIIRKNCTDKSCTASSGEIWD